MKSLSQVLTVTEYSTQSSIVDALKLAGFSVRKTVAFRQKGPSGVDKGIADLLVFHPCFAPFFALCIEVKKPGPIKWSSPEQRDAHEDGEFDVAQSAEQALEIGIAALELSDSKAKRIYVEKAQKILDAIRRAG